MKSLFFSVLIFQYFVLQVISGQVYSEDVLSCNFNKQLFRHDSIVKGIDGNAVYFSTKRKGLSLETNEMHSELWNKKDFSIELWVQTTAINQNFQVIAGNKDWNSGEIKDFTDNRYFGHSRISGVNKGWAIVCQPDGSWAWNIGNGNSDGNVERVENYRKDYRPTAVRQKINDGLWHQIVFTINRAANEARLYFDGQNVAIYFLGPVKDMDSGAPICLGNDPFSLSEENTFEGAIDEFAVYDCVLDPEEVANKYLRYVPLAQLPEEAKNVETLRLMSWNIWHGGRRRGREIGPQQVISFIKETNTDIVMMQETYGSGPVIADALGYYFYLSSENISIISKYPIEKTWVAYHELWSGIATVRLSENQRINIASIWLHYLPDWGAEVRQADATAKDLVIGEGQTRHKEIKVIIETLQNEIRYADQLPLVVGGDFNSPSHYDWTEATKQWHNNLIVDWPVSKEMWKVGFKDSFREVNPNLSYSTPSIEEKDVTNRIDYIYCKGRVSILQSDMHFSYKGAWPSDHPAVTTTIKLTE